jgi:nitrite reductase/ring-hydroxylating ferredoxin subunit
MTTQHVVREHDGRRFARACRTEAVTAESGHCFDLDHAHVVALFRVDGAVRAVTNICPHKHMSVIANGHVDNGTVRCPMHGWTYRIDTGEAVIGGASLRTYASFEADGWVWVEWPDDEVPRWAAAL